MSASKKKNAKKDNMFNYDPVSGRFVLVPLKWNLAVPSSLTEKKSSEKKQKRTVEPLHFTANDFREPQAKMRKTESVNSVRKGLFSMPSTKTSQGAKISLNRRSSLVRKAMNTKKPQMQNKINQVELSPLLNLEEVEEELLNKKASLRSYVFKSPSTPVINFTKTLKTEQKPRTFDIPEIIVEEQSQISSQMVEDIRTGEPKTPDSTSSNEFLKFEEMFSKEEMRNNCNESPISSMCNLLEDTGLGSIKKTKICSNKEDSTSFIITNLKNIIQSEQAAFEQYKSVHDANIEKLSDILSAIEKRKIDREPKTPNKENIPNQSNRRSIRLQNKSPLRTNNDKLLVSPGILRSGDLRKSTLKKNLAARKQEIQNKSPRTRKAFDLYNSFRGKNSILETPKLDRKALGETPIMARYVSMQVQNQCLLLQDTPVHK